MVSNRSQAPADGGARLRRCPDCREDRGASIPEASLASPRTNHRTRWSHHLSRCNGSDPAAGFTLLELMIVMVIIGILAAIAVPMYVSNVRHAREAALREDLRTMRSAIDAYTIDKQKAPQSLDDLVQAGYLKTMPTDPFTHRSDTWVPATSDTLSSIDQTDQGGIDDVHSGAQMTASDGTSYNSW